MFNPLARYGERTPLKEEVDLAARRRRLLKVGAAAALFALGVIDGSIPDLVANAIDFVKDMNVADLTSSAQTALSSMRR